MLGWWRKSIVIVPRGNPFWRETADGRGTTLVVTYAGLLVIKTEPMVVKTVALTSEQAAHAHAQYRDKLSGP